MPILRVEIIGEVHESIRPGLAQRIADRAGACLESRPQGTWVRVTYLPVDQYAENGAVDQYQPVFVSLLQADVPVGDARAEQMVRLTQAIATACDRPAEHVHILIEPPAAGRIAFGGLFQR